MTLSSKNRRVGAAGTRQSSRINTADSTSETDTTNLVYVSLPDGPSRISTRARAVNASSSSSSDQALAKHSKSAGSNQSNSVQLERNKPRNSSRKQKKLTELGKKTDEDVVNYILKPIEANERERWKGWCEVESEPVGAFTEQFSSLVCSTAKPYTGGICAA
jgi:hypothetical protein